MRERLQRVRAVVRLEWLTQRREPLTALYMLVFFLLAAAFAAAGPVELVRNRGSIPRDAAWSIMLSTTALTAFGQVITTMVAATVVLRDRADRVEDLLRTTSLRSREYLIGKLLAALGLLCLIYAAIPVGLVVGAAIGGGQVSHAARAVLAPYLIMVLPTMLAVGAIQFGLGALGGRLWVIVGQGLLLIWLWNGAVDAATRDGADLLVLLDPFGTAPLLRASSAWTDAQRATLAMPVTAGLVFNRVLWLVVGLLVAAVAVVRAPDGAQASTRRAGKAARVGAFVSRSGAPSASPSGVMSPGTALPAWRAVVAAAAHLLSWMLRDTGWRVLAALGTLNVAVHVVMDVPRGTPPKALTTLVVGAVELHARLFLILLATIYAGEIVWREREDRSAAFFDALPVRDGDAVAGRIVGLIAAQCALVVIVGGTAALCGVVRSGSMVEFGVLLRSLGEAVLVPFMTWTVLALAVHVLVQQKVAAHLLCIVGWMGAVWLGDGLAASADRRHVSWWLVLPFAGALTIVWLGWVRGERRAPGARCRQVRRRVHARFTRRR